MRILSAAPGLLLLGLFAFALNSLPARADDTGSEGVAVPDSGVRLPEPEEIEADFPEGERLSGRELYEKYIDRRNRESYQKLRIVSRDPGGSEQLSRFDLRVQDNRNGSGDAVDGVSARTRIDVHDPFDLRHTKYLIITKDPGPDDEFVYQPSARRVRRVDLRSTSFLGTDYTFNDLLLQNVEDASYLRHPDEEIDGTSVYVVETHVKETVDVEFHKTLIYLEQEHYVPLRIRYWDDFDVEVKEMRAPASTIRAFKDTHVATESTMRDLRQNTSSTLYIDDLDANPEFNRSTFTASRLSRGK